jgi:hypothetical protein
MSRKVKNLLAALVAGDLSVNLDFSLAERAAQVLATAARDFPYQPIPWRYLYKVVTQLKALPVEKSPDVKTFQGRTQKIRQILETDYKIGLITEGGGLRASVDADDYMQKVIKPTARRTLAVQARLHQRVGLVDANQLKAPENIALYRRIARGMRELNGLNLPQRFALAPKAEETNSAAAE